MRKKKQDARPKGKTPENQWPPKVWPARLWKSLFLIWLFLLTGFTAQWLGPPGGLQALRLRSLLDERKAHAMRLRQDVDRLSTDASRLERSRFSVEREIRRTLGYAAPDEILFDFSSGEAARGMLMGQLNTPGEERAREVQRLAAVPKR